MSTSRPSGRRERQVVRLLSLLGRLFEGGRPTVHELAAEFGTRRETIYRDLRALEDAGYPVVGDETGRLSHPRLLPEARKTIPELRLSGSEVSALLWAARQAQPAATFAEALSAACTKLRAMAKGKPSARLDEAVTSWSSGEKDYSSHRDTILRLIETILLRKRCAVEYHSPANATAKPYTFDPYRLVTTGGGLYCIGKVPRYGDIVTLAVDRIRKLTVAEEIFEVDPDFDPEAYRAEAFGVVREKPIDVVVRFSAEQAPYVRERQWHPSQRIRDLRDGRIELRFRAGGIFEITRWILGWGDAAEVVAPRSLREHLREMLTSAAANYGE